MPQIVHNNQSSARKRRIDETDVDSPDDDYCEVIEVKTKKARTEGISPFFSSVFKRVSDWVKRKTSIRPSLFPSGWESNSVKEAFAGGGQYLDEASGDKFMPKSNNIPVASNGGHSLSSAQQLHPQQRQQTQYPDLPSLPPVVMQRRHVPQGVLQSSGAMYSGTNQDSKNISSRKKLSTESGSRLPGFTKENPLEKQKPSYAAVVGNKMQSTLDSAGKPTTENLHEVSDCKENFSNTIGHSLSSDPSMMALQKSYVEQSVRPKKSNNSSVYDRTFSTKSILYSSSKTKTTIQKCFDLDEKERYKRALQQFCLTDIPPRSYPLGHVATRPSTSAAFDQPIRKLLFGAQKSGQTSLLDTPATTPSHSPSKSLTPQSSSPPAAASKLLPSQTSTPAINQETTTPYRKSLVAEKSQLEPVKQSETAEKCEKLVKQMMEIKERATLRLIEQKKKSQAEEMLLSEYAKKRDEDDDHLHRMVTQRLHIKPKIILDDLPAEEEEADEFPELSAEAESMVSKALSSGPNEVLSEAFRIKISRKDMMTLRGGEWLNDEVVNFYLSLIQERSGKDGRPSVHVFNTFFYPTIMQHGHSRVKRWTKQVDIFSKDLIIIPVHLGMHWCLACIDLRKQTISYYDSMLGKNWPCLEALKKYLEDESMDKKKQPFDTSKFRLECRRDIPQQMNGSDCGVFACKYAEYLSRDSPFTFAQENMPYFRRRIVYEILCKALM